MLLPAEIFKAYDIRGIVGKTLTPEIAEQIGRAIGTRRPARWSRTPVCIGRDGRLSGPELSRSPGSRPASKRRRRDRRRPRRHADAVLRHAPPADRLRGHGHRQPQPAGLQRPEDVVAGETLSGEAIQELRSAHRSTVSLRIRQRQLQPGRRGAGLPRAHRRRCQADAAHAHRRRLRQRRGRRLRTRAVPPPRLPRARAVLRGRRHTSPTTIPIRRNRRTCRT